MKDLWAGVRTDTIETINNFVTQGWEPGSFVLAVLENDLMGAVACADIDNRFGLFEICNYIYNETPSECHGSPEKVRAWQKFIRENPEHAKVLKEIDNGKLRRSGHQTDQQVSEN